MASKRIRLDERNWRVFEAAISAMAEVQKTFGRALEPSFVAELYAAKELGLEVNLGTNDPGYDDVDELGKRYQIKYRSSQTLNVDLNNFNFDYLILVNLDADYRLTGMWRTTEAEARRIFVWREKFRKFQATQAKVKQVAEQVR